MMAVVIAVIMCMSMTSLVAFAAGTNSITVTGAQEGETYSIYKLLGLSVHANADSEDETDAYDGFRYTIEDGDWKVFWTTGAGAAYIDTNTAGDETYVVWKDGKDSASEMEAFGKAAAAYAAAQELDPIASKTVDSEADPAVTAAFTGLENGYYLITTTFGTATVVASTPNNADQDIREKNSSNTTDKDVKEAEERNGSEEAWADENDAAVGDTVDFRAKVTIAKNSINVKYHDTMTSGLDWTGESNTKVYTDEDLTTELNSSYYSVAAGADGETFVVTFTDAYVATLTAATTDVYVGYSAVLNDNAVITTDQTNTGKVTWGDAGESSETTTTTKTHQFEILKYDGTDTGKNPLAGAKFKLYTVATDGTALKLAKNADGTVYRIVDTSDEGATLPTGFTLVTDDKIVTLDSGNITVIGVDSDDYYLEETDAPTGYNALSSRQKVEVNAANNLVSEVENLSGTELPSTGGIGTTIFYIVGAILVIGAGVLLVTRRRMNNNK